MTLFRPPTCRILKSGNPSVGFLRHAFRRLLRQQNRCSWIAFQRDETCVGTCMLWASGIGSLEHLITDPPLIAFRNDLSRAVCWFNFSHVIRHRRQHQSPMYLSNPTKNFFVTSFVESGARSTVQPIDSSIKERNNPRSGAFSLFLANVWAITARN